MTCNNLHWIVLTLLMAALSDRMAAFGADSSAAGSTNLTQALPKVLKVQATPPAVAGKAGQLTPKDWQRSDEQIEAAIARLVLKHFPAATQERVWYAARDRVVTVWGTVPTVEMARSFLERLTRIRGVKEIQNGLTIAVQSQDAEIARQIREILSHDPETRASGVAVSVVDGTVFLSGMVRTADEQSRAVMLSAAVPGVAKVYDGLRLTGQNLPVRRVPTVRRTYTPRR